MLLYFLVIFHLKENRKSISSKLIQTNESYFLQLIIIIIIIYPNWPLSHGLMIKNGKQWRSIVLMLNTGIDPERCWLESCSLVAELRGRSSTWPSRRHTRAPLAAAIQLMSGHRAQPRSNQGWFWGGRKTGVPGEQPSKPGKKQQTQLTYEAGSWNWTRDHSGWEANALTAMPPVLQRVHDQISGTWAMYFWAPWKRLGHQRNGTTWRVSFHFCPWKKIRSGSCIFSATVWGWVTRK